MLSILTLVPKQKDVILVLLLDAAVVHDTRRFKASYPLNFPALFLIYFSTIYFWGLNTTTREFSLHIHGCGLKTMPELHILARSIIQSSGSQYIRQ